MKKFINKIILLFAVSVVSFSCDDDPNLTTLETVNFPEQIQTTSSTIVIAKTNLTKLVTTISWPKVSFPIDAPVSYAIEIDVPANTVGNNAWENALRIEAGTNVLSKSFSGLELNDIASELGLLPNQEGEIVVRIEAYMDRASFSEPLVLNVTPFESQINFPEIYVVGGFQGWNFGTAAALKTINPGVYQGYITFPANQNLEFKFSTDLEGVQVFGAAGNGLLEEDGTVNFSVPNAGSYQITVDLNTLTYTAVPYSWGIIGTSTPGGWNSDTDMTYDYQNFEWVYQGALVSGALKFRLNDTWLINYGPAGDPSGQTSTGIVLFDNPGAHTILAPGNYKITYKHNPATPATATYTVTQL